MKNQKTYWHLQELNRAPTEYEIVSSRLHAYTRNGFEVNVPLRDWYGRYQSGSPLRCGDWDRFRDPRETTYTKYTSIQSLKEIYVNGLLESIDTSNCDRKFPDAWVKTLSQVLSPMRYPCHGFQMIASYVGQMAPSGRITLACLFQAADEMRRVHRVAYRVRQLQSTFPGFGDDGKSIWEKDPMWQPLREAVEKLLVTYDWGESFTALNLVLKPLIDDLLMVRFGAWAREKGDDRLESIFLSLYEDCRWHQSWTQELVRMVTEDNPDNRAILQAWIEKWTPMASKAVEAFKIS